MEAIKLCRLDTPIIFIEARINLSRFVVTGCAAKTSATVTFPSLNLISLFAFCFNIWYQILKQNAKREMRLRLGKVTVADVLAAQPVTTNLLKFMRASIKMIGVSNLQSFIASMTQKLTLSDISDESKNYLDKAGITTACLRIKSKWTAGGK